jgi:signal transduction histidine kinase
MTRWRQGYELVEVIRELGIVERSILEHGIENFFEQNSLWVDGSSEARRNLGDFFEDSITGSVQRYVENFSEQLQTANANLTSANERLSRMDESRLRLLRTVGHELANVLNTLRLTVTVITTGTEEAIRAEMLETCQRNIGEMTELLNDLRDYSVLIAGGGSPQIEEMDVREFGGELEASFRALMQDAGLRLDLRIDPNLSLVRSDRKKIRQIITNLITNAIRYSRKDNSNPIVVLAFRSLDQDSWQIMVEDFGVGIPTEDLHSIFDEFKRLSHSPEIAGAGLGLAISKRLAEELKGTIEVFSEVGQGSRFVVSIPKLPS